MSAAHTPGPWFLSGMGTVLAGKSRYIVGDYIEPHNARRIVACVNVLEEITDGGIEELQKVGGVKELMNRAHACAAERDALRERERELVEALRDEAGSAEWPLPRCECRLEPHGQMCPMAIRLRSRAILAKVSK